MLAQTAQHTGFKPLVIDLYGDVDTRFYAEDIIRVPSLAEECVIPAVKKLMLQYPVEFGLYGAGFEQYPASLAAFCKRLSVLGNQPAVFAKVQDKPGFFATLTNLGIPFPDVSFVEPAYDDGGWLIKPKHGQGGVGIKRYFPGSAPKDGVYWQRKQQGEPHSVLFLTDGKRCRIVGFNRQWTVALSNMGEFIFSGVINHTDLSPQLKRQLTSWLSTLMPEFSLKGLNSMDFIYDDTSAYVLEINPRPPASMQLYQQDLLSLHIKACQGEHYTYLPESSSATTFQVIYAKRDICIPEGFHWPDICQDIPVAGSTIGAGQPICSMIVSGNEPNAVLDGLQQQEQLIQHLHKVSDLWNTAPA